MARNSKDPKKNRKKKKFGSNLTKELMKKNELNSPKFDLLMEDKNNVEKEIENAKNLTDGEKIDHTLADNCNVDKNGLSPFARSPNTIPPNENAIHNNSSDEEKWEAHENSSEDKGMNEAWKKRDHDEISELSFDTEHKRAQHYCSQDGTMIANYEDNSAFSRQEIDEDVGNQRH